MPYDKINKAKGRGKKKMDAFIKDKINKTCENILKKYSDKRVCEIPSLKYKETGYKMPGELPKVNEDWKTFGRNDRVYGRDKHYWFYTSLTTPEVKINERAELEVVTGAEGKWAADNPQGLIYINGEAIQGLDTNHTRVRLDGGKRYDIIIYFYTGMADFKSEVNLNVMVKNLDVEKLYYDIKVPYDAAMCFGEDDYNHIKTI